MCKDNVICVADLLRRRAAEAANEPALSRHDGATLTFGEWLSRARRAGAGLRRLGVRPGDRVGLLFSADRWHEFAVGYFAAQEVGAVPAMLMPDWPADYIARSAELLGMRVVIGHGAEVPAPSHLSTVTLDDLLAHPADPGEPVVRDSHDIAGVLWTSGTTGAPKCVIFTHANVVRPITSDIRTWPTGQRPRGFYVHPFAPGGNTAHSLLLEPLAPTSRSLQLCPIRPAVRTTLLGDMADAFLTTYPLPWFQPELYWATLRAYRPLQVVLTPSMARVLPKTAQGGSGSGESVRIVLVGSAPVEAPVLEELAGLFPNAIVLQRYASTESIPCGTLVPCDPAHDAAVGRIDICQTQVRLAPPDDQTGRRMIEVRWPDIGVPVRQCRDAVEASTGGHDGWVRMRDFGELRGGLLYITGRADDAIVVGSAKIQPGVVEEAFHGHPAVEDVAVVGIPRAIQSHELAAVVVPRAELPWGELRAFVQARLPASWVPTKVCTIDAIPRTAGGKVLTIQLRHAIADCTDPGWSTSPANPIPPSTGDRPALAESL